MRTTLGAKPEHYRLLDLVEGVIAPWEDGLRTDPNQVGFEWWYFDCQLDDGSRLNIEFHTKPPYVSPSKPLTPFVSLILDRPGGERIVRACTAAPEEFSASRQGCDVRIGKNTFEGDTRTYRIHVEIDDLTADVELHSECPPWRPATGHTFFGEREETYVAWLPVVPRASVVGSLTLEDRTESLRGTGYHDHNWGNSSLRKLVDHWYWARARIGDYTVVALMFFSNAAHGSHEIAAFMVAKSGRILASAVESDALRFRATEPITLEQTGVPAANRLSFELDAPPSRFALTLERREDTFVADFGKAGAYHRFAGDVTLEHRDRGEVVDTARGKAMWELLHFGERAA